MERDSIRESATFVAGLTIGALIGTVAAILMAPQSGKRTRRQISRRAGQWSDEAADRIDDARDSATRLADRSRERTRRLAERARRRVEETGDRLTDAVESGRERLRS